MKYHARSSMARCSYRAAAAAAAVMVMWILHFARITFGGNDLSSSFVSERFLTAEGDF